MKEQIDIEYVSSQLAIRMATQDLHTGQADEIALLYLNYQKSIKNELQKLLEKD